jgi:hypothetical protein
LSTSLSGLKAAGLLKNINWEILDVKCLSAFASSIWDAIASALGSALPEVNFGRCRCILKQ